MQIRGAAAITTVGLILVVVSSCLVGSPRDGTVARSRSNCPSERPALAPAPSTALAVATDAGDDGAPSLASSPSILNGQDESDAAKPNAAPSSQETLRLRLGATQVYGRLNPERIQTAVRAQYGEFRRCFNAGLERNPQLSGIVRTTLLILGDGTVDSVKDAGSDLPDPEVIACMQSVFARICFNRPEAGLVTVKYPIALSPG